MHGAGNDYIYVDCFSQQPPPDPAARARQMSDRHFGVGGDGLILICPSAEADAEMKMYNADGSYAEMCGNGIRCVAKFVYERQLARANPLRIASAGRVFSLELTIDPEDRVSRVRVDMGEPELRPEKIPTTLPGHPVSNAPLAIDGHELLATCVSMGNPHCVIFVDELSDELVHGYGPQLETSEFFPERVNVEFVQVASTTQVHQRTWERGSGETLACGTGASAVCVAGVLTGRTARKVVVHLLGGDLELEWDEATNHVFMTGPATEVFQGVWTGGAAS